MTVTAPVLTYRPAEVVDLDACAQIWRIAINDYLPRTGQHDMPEDVSGVRHLYDHLIATDPERFWVATAEDGRVVGFTSATLRGDVWFLSMLFVLPEFQRSGVGQALLARTMPANGAGTAIAVGSDTAYPPSNGLYARLGMPGRTPVWAVVGRPKPGWRPPPFAEGTVVSLIETDADGAVAGGLQAELDALDREVFGFARETEHRYVRRDRRRGFTYRDPGGALLGYGYVAASGRIAPVAVRDAGLLGPVVGHLLTAFEPPGASAAWVTGDSDGAMATLLDAGLRLEGYPLLFGWSRPFADFSRCLPVSPGLL